MTCDKNTNIVASTFATRVMHLKGVYHGKYWLTPSAASFGQLHVNGWTWLTGSARASANETDRSSPHASVSRMFRDAKFKDRQCVTFSWFGAWVRVRGYNTPIRYSVFSKSSARVVHFQTLEMRDVMPNAWYLVALHVARTWMLRSRRP